MPERVHLVAPKTFAGNFKANPNAGTMPKTCQPLNDVEQAVKIQLMPIGDAVPIEDLS